MKPLGTKGELLAGLSWTGRLPCMGPYGLKREVAGSGLLGICPRTYRQQHTLVREPTR